MQWVMHLTMVLNSQFKGVEINYEGVNLCHRRQNCSHRLNGSPLDTDDFIFKHSQ